MTLIQEPRIAGGKTRYRVEVRLKGYPTRTATFDRKTDAKKKEWAQDVESEIRDRRRFRHSEAQKHTLGEVLDRFLDSVAPSLKSAADRRRHLLRRKKRLATYALADLSPALIAEQRDTLLAKTTYRGRQREPATVVRYLAALSHALTTALKEWGWLGDNPVLKVKTKSYNR